jgi:hypothetical protein
LIFFLGGIGSIQSIEMCGVPQLRYFSPEVLKEEMLDF